MICMVLVGRCCGDDVRLVALGTAAGWINIFGVNGDAALLTADPLEANYSVDLRVNRVVFADAHIVAYPELGSSLPDHNCAGPHQLAIVSLHAEPLGIAVPPVALAAYAFLMSHDRWAFLV